MSPGDLVRVRAYGGKELVRRIAAIMGDTILICKEEEYQTAKKEKRAHVAVGFKKTDVIEEKISSPR